MPSVPSSENTRTMSSFHPDFESTQQFDTATQELQLPHIRSSAQRFSYYNPPQPAMDMDMDMDSSFVRDSFPEFTQKSPSPESSVSVEIGRGAKGSPRGIDVSDIPLPSDSLYDLKSTPPQRSRPTPSRKTDSLRKEASLRRAQSSSMPAEKKANASQRRSLSDMHHKVHRESESSFIGEDRPTSHTINPKNTRFTSYSRDQGLQTQQSTPQRPIANVTATWTAGTQQSFILPDLPNITELVSGVRKDGTPVFARSAKSRSRFTSPSNNNTLTHHKINSIAVPDDEKAIFASLQLLKDKVAHLEMEKSESQKRLEEYHSEVSHLKSRLDMEQKLRRPDSALGEDDEPGAKEKWRHERATLQSTIKTLQDRLDRSERKLSVSDIAVKRMTHERDDLVTQLGVAYYNSEELKNESCQLRAANQHLEAESESLKADNARLRVKLAHIKAQFNDETQQWNQRESNLKAKIQRRDATVRELHDFTLQSAPQQDDDTVNSARSTVREDGLTSRRRSSGRLGQDTKHNILHRIENEIRNARSGASTSAPNHRSRSRSKSNTRSKKPQQASVAPQEYAGEMDSTTDLDFSRPVRNETREEGEEEEEEDSRDITYLSFLDPNEIARLRKTLEEERRAAKLPRPASAPPVQDNDTITRTTNLPRKSSLRDVTKDDTSRFTIRSQVDENTGLLKNVRIQSPHMSDAISYSEPRETTEASMLSTSSRRRQRSKSIEELTSAFILPDITLHTHPGASETSPSIPHDTLNCTFCPPDYTEDKNITIPTPIPVSTRDMDDTNATIRPSQPPPIALATVLKQLGDEVTHLKLLLSNCEKAYTAHDPALGRRKRVALKGKMERLVAQIERRSEQIYGLYDVLEGQRGEEQEQHVEDTLQSLGIDVDTLGGREVDGNGKGKGGRTWGVGEQGFESEDEVSWEGISGDESVVLPRRR